MPAPLLVPFMLWLSLGQPPPQDAGAPAAVTAGDPAAPDAANADPGAAPAQSPTETPTKPPLADEVAEEVSDTDPAAAGPAPTGPAAALNEGLQALEDLDLFAAEQKLNEALSAGPYKLEQVVALYAALGITRAYLEDEEGALSAFGKLLAVAPGHSLAYTTSPKATFLFERVRKESKARRAAELRASPPAVVPFGFPVTMTLERPADPTGLFARAEVLVRLKGEDEYRTLAVELPPVGGASTVELGTWEESAGITDETGQVGLIVEVALHAYDEHGWEVFRRPAPERPLEVPVGFDAPGPWYTQWWVWALGGAATAAVTASVATVSSAGVAAYLLWPEPATVPATSTLPTAVPMAIGGAP